MSTTRNPDHKESTTNILTLIGPAPVVNIILGYCGANESSFSSQGLVDVDALYDKIENDRNRLLPILLKNVSENNEPGVSEILKQEPALLLETGIVPKTGSSGPEIKGTALQIATYKKMTAMTQLITPFFDQIVNGDSEKSKQENLEVEILMNVRRLDGTRSEEWLRRIR